VVAVVVNQVAGIAAVEHPAGAEVVAESEPNPTCHQLAVAIRARANRMLAGQISVNRMLVSPMSQDRMLASLTLPDRT